MYKTIIIILFSIFYSINNKSYSSFELANEVKIDINTNYFKLIDLDNLLSTYYFSNIQDVLDEIHDEKYRLTFLIIIEQFDFSSVPQNKFMDDFMIRLISNEKKQENYFILIYSVNDKILLYYIENNIITKDEIDKFYDENCKKYENYQEILLHFLEDVDKKMTKKSLIVVGILFAIIIVIAAIVVITIVCYRKKKCCFTKKNKNNNKKNVEIVNQQQMNNINNNYQNQNQNQNYNQNYNQVNNNNYVNYVAEKNDFYNYQSGGNVYNNDLNNFNNNNQLNNFNNNNQINNFNNNNQLNNFNNNNQINNFNNNNNQNVGYSSNNN